MKTDSLLTLACVTDSWTSIWLCRFPRWWQGWEAREGGAIPRDTSYSGKGKLQLCYMEGILPFDGFWEHWSKVGRLFFSFAFIFALLGCGTPQLCKFTLAAFYFVCCSSCPFVCMWPYTRTACRPDRCMSLYGYLHVIKPTASNNGFVLLLHVMINKGIIAQIPFLNPRKQHSRTRGGDGLKDRPPTLSPALWFCH